MVKACAPQRPSADPVIPVIDLAPYLSGVPGVLEATAAQLRSALETIGLFLLMPHQVPQDLIARTFLEIYTGQDLGCTGASFKTQEELSCLLLLDQGAPMRARIPVLFSCFPIDETKPA